MKFKKPRGFVETIERDIKFDKVMAAGNAILAVATFAVPILLVFFGIMAVVFYHFKRIAEREMQLYNIIDLKTTTVPSPQQWTNSK